MLIGGAAIGGFLLLGGDDDGDDKASDDTSQTDEPSESEEPSEEPTTEEPSEEPTEATEDPSGSADPGGGFDPALIPVVGFWTGTYICGQGVSKLDLAIAPGTGGDGSLDAVFELRPDLRQPGRARGQLPDGRASSSAASLTLNGYHVDRAAAGLRASSTSSPTVDGELPDTI